MTNGILIIDDAQRLRAARPNTYGMNPWVAERLQGFGIDPYDRAESIRQRVAREAGVFGSTGLAPRRSVFDAAQVVPLAIDYDDVTQRTILDMAPAEVEMAEHVGEVIVPTAPVDTDKGNFVLDDYAESIEVVNDTIGTHGDVAQVHANHGFVPYQTEAHYLSTSVNRAVAGIAPQLVSVVRSAQKLTQRIKVAKEVRIGVMTGDPNNFHPTCRRALLAGQHWNGGGGANPIADMQAMIAAMIAFPNLSVFGLEAWQAVQANATMREILASQLSNAGMLRTADWSQYWGIVRTVVSEARYKLPTEPNLRRIYPQTSFALLHVNAAPAARTWAKCFTLRGGAQGWTTTAWFDQRPGGKGADCIKTGYDGVEVVIDNQFGAICTGMRV